MKIEVLTLFPEIYDVLKTGIIGNAIAEGKFELGVTNIRDFSTDKHRHCDDTPFGGGAGMVMTPQPLYDALEGVDCGHKARRIYLSPKGRVLDSSYAQELSTYDKIVLLNGSYEGIDQRIIDECIDEELSIGDYVLTSGDFATLVVINSLCRFIDGVLGSSDSLLEESFCDDLLEYPQYTRPQEFHGVSVPEVLLNGNHAHIKQWRYEQQLMITQKMRPDLYEKHLARKALEPKPKKRKK